MTDENAKHKRNMASFFKKEKNRKAESEKRGSGD